MTRQMALVGFLQAQNCTNLPSSWRHPESRDDSMSADYYQEIARILEAGKFHMAFFDDRLAMPDRYGNDHARTVEYGIRCVKMDPLIVLTTMGMVTTKLGLGSTCSTTYYEPFDVARRFATLDLMSGGRAGWNVVTSLNDGEAHNMGKDAHLEHDFRYDRADEFMEVVLGHWDTWEDGSLIMDKTSGRFADPAKVKRLDHKGEFYKSRGPFTVPRSAQGHPVIIQAGALRPRPALCGAMGRGDLHRRAQRGRRQGRLCRGPQRSGESRPRSRPDAPLQPHHAGLRRDQGRGRGQDGASSTSCRCRSTRCRCSAEALNFDFASKPLDEPLTIEDLKSMQGILGIRDGVLKNSGKTNPSARDFRHLLRPRPGAGRDRRRPEGDRGQAGGDVRRARLRRLCHRGHHRARLLRRFRQACRAGIAAPRPVSQGLCRQDAARESRPGAARRRRLENQRRRPRPNNNRRTLHALAQIHRRRQDILGHRRGRQRDRRQRRPLRRMAARKRNRYALKDMKIELPLIPRTFYCVGLNYLKHLQGSRRQGRHGAQRARPAWRSAIAPRTR